MLKREVVERAARVLVLAALSTSACGGKSEHTPRTEEGGRVAQGGVTTGGTATTSGGTATASGGTATASAGTATASGGTATASGGTATASGGATAGRSGVCLDETQRISFEHRLCRTAEDCTMLIVPRCCELGRVWGVAIDQGCAAPVIDCNLPLLDCAPCATADCADRGFLMDDDARVVDFEQIEVRCEVGEPGAGLCVTRRKREDPNERVDCNAPLLLAARTCPAGALCVHPAGTDPPLPFCTAIPPGCGAPVACSCLPADLCNRTVPGVCQKAEGHQVYCGAPTP